MLVGLDEAGVGPAFGSLWAAAVGFAEGVAPEGLNDSKKMTEKRRVRLRTALDATHGVHVGLGEVTQWEIDVRGLAWARRVVFHRALDDFVARHGIVPTDLIVDGTLFAPWRENVPYECRPKADATVSQVMAASVYAKTTRDAQIAELVDCEPELDLKYGLRANKGYLTKQHIAGLHAHGWSALHRRTYRIPGMRGGA